MWETPSSQPGLRLRAREAEGVYREKLHAGPHAVV